MIKGTKSEILKRIGNSIRGHRLQANITQQMLAERSGVSLNAIRHLESGVCASLGTFVQACRTLGKDRWIVDLEPKDELSPIQLAAELKRHMRTKKRIRATARKAGGT
jgi:transcriptional regulator with XRE-family HTH domain